MGAKCPQCQQELGVEGEICNQFDYINPGAFFRPKGLSFLSTFTTNIKMENVFFTCLSCGFLWSKIDPQLLRRFRGGRDL